MTVLIKKLNNFKVKWSLGWTCVKTFRIRKKFGSDSKIIVRSQTIKWCIVIIKFTNIF